MRRLPIPIPGRVCWLLMGMCLAVLLLGNRGAVSQEDERSANREDGPVGQLVRVPIPISGDVDRSLKRIIEGLQTDWQGVSERPVLILQFGDEDAESSDASEFERALSLSRFLGSESLNRVRTVAFLAGQVRGHAVLPVLACEEIIALPNAQLGAAGIRESYIDGTVRQGYVEMAERRRTIPVPVVRAMLDRDVSLIKAQTMDGVRYVLGDQLPSLEAESAIRSTEQLVPAGELGVFSGSELRLKFGFASHLVKDRIELASVLGLPVGTIDEDPTLGARLQALRVDITGPFRAETASWVERSIREAIDRRGANLICLVIDSPGGSATDAARLGSYLAGLDSSAIRTVAFVPDEARADAALIALACDHLVIGPEATLGGPARRITRRQLDDLAAPVRAIAQRKHRGWSLPLALLDPELTVREYTRVGTGQVRYFSEVEWSEQEDADLWQAGAEIPTAQGVSGSEALDLRLARFSAERWDDVRALYQIQEEPPVVAPGWAHVLVEFLASPQVSGVLLFVGWFALMMEFASPGIGLPGFASGVSFLLYFWANVLHGTAGWLEVILFAAGILCVVLEIFVIPGIGAFGIGGAIMIVASLILASQTFIIPQNSYEWGQMPASLLTVAAAGTGAFTAMFFMRRVLTEAPVFRRVALPPPDDEGRERIEYQESLVHREHLLGKCGRTTTVLRPAGKVRFGDSVVDVISDGEIIPVGTDVCVAKVTGSEVLVRPLPRTTDLGNAT